MGLSEFKKVCGKFKSTTVLEEFGFDRNIMVEFENGIAYYTINLKNSRTKNYKYIAK